jgi:hypothetical protein
MQIRVRETGTVMYENEFRALFPNTGFPAQLTEAIINEFGGDVVFEGPQAQPTRYQVAFRDGVEQVGGKWYTKYSVADMEQEAKAAMDANQAASQRAFRNTLLSDCDWTQLPDASVNTQAWATYRQALRDVTSQAGFPWDIQWPEKPQ